MALTDIGLGERLLRRHQSREQQQQPDHDQAGATTDCRSRAASTATARPILGQRHRQWRSQ